MTDHCVDLKELQERVRQFNALELPGQIPMMHTGTSYLVNDLWRAVQALNEMLHDREPPDVTASDAVVVQYSDPLAVTALLTLASAYRDRNRKLSDCIRERVKDLHGQNGG